MGNSLSSPVGSLTSTAAASMIHRMLNETEYLDWVEDAIAADVIPMDELIAMGAGWRGYSIATSLMRGVSGIASFISSSIFIWMIMRSHDRLSTTQHRLLLGLCIFDIIFSSSWSTFNLTSPSETGYITWNARGNDATCIAQGFLNALGGGGGLFYNASLNLYFLAVVKYKKSDEFIRAKIEPFLHGAPIVIALTRSIYRLVNKHYNNNGGGWCVAAANRPPHCIGIGVGEVREGFEIPCYRGIEDFEASEIYALVEMFIPAVIIVVSLGMIHRAVRTQEKKISKYGVGSLRSNLNQSRYSATSSTAQQEDTMPEEQSTIWSRMRTSLSTSLKSRSSQKADKPATRSNNVKSQSRAVMHKAYAYTVAWFLCYGIWMIGVFIKYATGSWPRFVNNIITLFAPLQGFFNLLIFMHPKVMAARKSKRGGQTVSWCQAISTAFWSRGNGGKKRQGGNRRSTNLRSSGGNRRSKKNKMPANNKLRKKRADTPQEEEKSEIQVPDNMNSSMTKAMYSAASTAIYAPNITPSSETTSRVAVNPPPADVMVGMTEEEGSEDNVTEGNALVSAAEDPPEEDTTSIQGEEGTEAFEEENADAVPPPPVTAGSPISADDGQEQEEIAMSNQDDEDGIKADELVVSVDTTAGEGEQKEEESESDVSVQRV